jgi:type II secretory pathway pseudopilin PulG
MKTKRLIHNPSGFTLLESLFAAILIGLVIAALVASNSAFTMANAAGVDLSTAEFLIEEIRELTANTAFDDLNSLAGDPFWPNNNITPAPSSAEIQAFSVFTQQVAVDPCGSEFGVDNDEFVRITVTILKNTQPVSQASWIRARLD